METTFKQKKFLLVALIFFFYVWTNNYECFSPQKDISYFNFLAKSLLNGHLYLDVEVPESILADPNPYDPNLRKFNTGGYHDFSLYQNKFYLYYGVIPSLIIYLPYQIIFKSNISDALVCVFFTFGIFIFSIFIKTLISH